MFDQLLDGVAQGRFKIPNITALDYQPQATQESILGTELTNEGTSLDTITTGDDLLVNISFNRFNAQSLAMASMGGFAEITAGTANVTDEVVGLLGGEGNLSRMNVSSLAIRGVNITVDDTTGFTAGNALTNNATGALLGVIEEVVGATHLTFFLQGTVPLVADVVTDDGGSTTATISAVTASNSLAAETTDFVTDTTNGSFAVVAAGALDLAALTYVKVNYSHTKLTGSVIYVNTNTTVTGPFIYKAQNLVTAGSGTLVQCIIPQLTLTPASAIALRGDDRGVIQLSGTAQLIAGSGATYGYDNDAPIYLEVKE
jgi:hypothetical protein